HRHVENVPPQSGSGHLDLQLKVDQLGHRVAAQGLHDLAEGSAYVVGLGAHHGHSQNGQLTVILRFNLRNRDVESVPQPILDAAHHLTFILETPGFTHQQPDAEGTNQHNCRLQMVDCKLHSPPICNLQSTTCNSFTGFAAPVQRGTPESGLPL